MITPTWRGCCWRLGLSLFLFLSLPSQAAEIFEDVSVRGSLSTRYKLRTTGGESDNDLDVLFTTDIGEPLTDRFSGSLQIGGIFDLDGQNDPSQFTSAYDGMNNGNVPRIYHGYVDGNDLQPFERIRIGRQHRFELESLYFDGAAMDWRKAEGLQLITYGGVPVHLFESDNGVGTDPGDWLAGGALQYDYLSRARFRFDVAHVKDHNGGFRAYAGDFEDTLFGTTLWVDPVERVRLMGRFTAFHDQVRDLNFDGRYFNPDIDLTAQLRMYGLLHEEGVRAIDFDRYGFIGSYKPFFDINAILTKGFANKFSLDGGVGFRILTEDQIASAFNHGYQRYFLTASSFDFLNKDLSLSLTGDYYNNWNNELKNDTFGVSFEAEQSLFEKRLRVAVGTAYYLYKFNLLLGNESEDTQVYFVRFRGKILDRLEGRLGYEFEDSEFNAFHTVETRVTWSF